MTNQIENQQEKLPAKYIADNMALMARDPESCSVAFGFDWQQELCANALRLLEEYDGVLRRLCSYLAAGGYNSEGLIDPQTADNKIRDGIDHIVKVEKVRAARCQPAATAHPATEDVPTLHRKLAGETLRADQGWARYKAANAARNAAEAAFAAIQPQAFIRLFDLVGRITSYRYSMSYNDSYFGEPAGLLKSTVRDIEKLLGRGRMAPAPAAVLQVEARAATVHKRIDALCTAANTPDGDYFDASTNLMLAVRELLVTLGHPHAFDIDAARARGES